MSYDVLRIDPSERVSLKVRKLSVAVKLRKRQAKDVESMVGDEVGSSHILQNISFDLPQNEMMAIMGGSGSGKTTLLNTLSQRLNVTNKKLEFSGSVNFYKREHLVEPHHHIRNSYLLQDDFFAPGLTTWEFLKFQADLQLNKTSKQQKADLINQLLEILEISHLKHKVISTFTSHINFSGGERRRVSIAAQLLKRPSVLFLDEPTTGLDTSSSLKLIQVLRQLSSSTLGVTVVLSIHQPRPEILELFDKICLLTRGGRLVYYGSLAYSYDYFMKLNLLSTASQAQPSAYIDRIMALSVKDSSSRENELKTAQKIAQLVECWSDEHLEPVSPVDFGTNLKVFETPRNMKISLVSEIWVLTKRTFIMTYRDHYGLGSMVGISLTMATICGWIFYKPHPDLAGIRSYTSSLYVMMEILGFLPLFIEIERLWEYDGLLFFREYTENQVSIIGFIVSRKLGKLLLEDTTICLGFGFISYFMFGLRLSVELGGATTLHYFWNYLAVTVLIYLCGMSSALAFFAISSSFPICAIYQNVFYQLQNSACGYFINAATMPVYVRWTKYICYFWYGFGALTSNQYTNWEGACPYDDEARCREYTGRYQLDVLGFPENWIAVPISILVAWYWGFNVLAAIGFKFRNYDVSMAKQKQNTIGDEEETHTTTFSEKDVAPTPTHDLDNEERQDVNLQLDGIVLDALSPVLALKKQQPYRILDTITANFDHNCVNVIMGPSGSGKTSLLNFISNRLSKSSRFQVQGSIKLNGVQTITSSQLSKISGYVTQYDSSLIPHLTVRETFYYQARLRLPAPQHSRIPVVINTLIRQMGLVDCADTLIGNEFLKGVSGGERRRVSIGIQLLSRPKVLFLDEPTSGLDSTTSVSILNLLQNLTREHGTTIITTIHQPSEAIFAQFGSLLLLGRGGHVIYTGASSGAEAYLQTVGFHKPAGVNTADYILDLVSHGIDEDKETASLRITKLVQEWQVRAEVDFAAGAMVDVKRLRKLQLPLRTRFRAIFARQLLSSFRSRDALFSRSFQVVALAVVHTLFFAPLKNTKEGIDNRLGLIQEVLNFYFIGLINNFSIFPIERDIFFSEYRDGIYNNLEFQVVYLVIESAVELITCVIFSALIVFVVGLPRTPATFFGMLLTCFASINVGESLGIIVNCVLAHVGLAMNILSSIIILAVFMGGTMALYMPQFFRAWNYINPLKYGVGICAELSFRGLHFRCDEGCSLSSGDAVLDYYGLANHLPTSVGALVGCLVVYRLLAVMACEVKIRKFL
ncbi:hypothetical protein PSN45_003730 [Yamadazyma tenuis]|uniref:ABC transporter domain-containing protein n=1 Tax=Candida tenuis (strain ATCC 10573 / BCRC 21748 / CBS 615 / JCM 9827 / NBRC 10315 / NRRL Y-1498 / VKM Y-70) TaxID=590646 RepID=G3B3G7_CANTC|nr:uncharacterized protein CANTEDRAFT_134734 [Yamadazyma tenuis ATCC 10573]EGV64158.1 hypothetical protein CANTEDRAFT_134734 [Yamadazyma tenuis ATCC 10573]WEJ96194.1 hypothetical protein PSN45_003730 [Yamadazyma tenuis]